MENPQITSKNIQDIFENAQNDPSLFSNIDIEKLLDKIETDKNDYLENKSLADISREIFDAIHSLENITHEQSVDYCKKLTGYRYVDSIHELRMGKYTRWIRKDNAKLAIGSVLLNVKIDDDVQLMFKNNANMYTVCKFDNFLIFQKLGVEEQLILMSYDYLHT